MIRAGTFALALFASVWCLAPVPGFAQWQEGPGGIIYGNPACEPGAYIAGPDEPSWVDPCAIEQAANNRRVLDAWFLRAEYLNWSFEDPGDSLFGSVVAGIDNPRIPQLVVDPGSTLTSTAIVPDASRLRIRHNNGVRVTTGADFLDGGKFELNAFLLEKADSQYTLFGEASDQVDPNQNFQLIATSTLVNDQLSSNYETYNHSFQATYESRLWGTGADYFFDVDRVGLFQFMPTIGLRYISLTERLTQRGIFRDTTILPQIFDEVTTIDSATWNNIVAGQTGFRAEIVSRWVTLGVDPRVGLGIDAQKARVIAANFQGGGDPVLHTREYDNHALFTFDVHAYTALHITPNCSLRIGYNFLWLNRVTRPEDNVYYNEIVDAAGNRTTDVRVRTSRHTFTAEGVTVGAEMKF